MGKKKCVIFNKRLHNREKSNHHLRPRTKEHGREGPKVPVFMDTHHKIHELFTNEELDNKYNTVDALRDELRERLISEVMNGPLIPGACV